ncbi:MAG: hypothetical protein LBL80_03115 [Ruminococcus sp.]|jgi:hypothetical protein|nr:hypothetical protein [Ruminococcus sp.]
MPNFEIPAIPEIDFKEMKDYAFALKKKAEDNASAIIIVLLIIIALIALVSAVNDMKKIRELRKLRRACTGSNTMCDDCLIEEI